MESPDELSSGTPQSTSEVEQCIQENVQNSAKSSDENIAELQDQVIANLQKPNVPNINVPERIVICLDVCFDDESSIFRLGDGSTFTQLNMFRRILDFFFYSKIAMNKKTEFALIAMNNTGAVWLHDFTNNFKEINNALDSLTPEQSSTETFDFENIYSLLKERVLIPSTKEDSSILPPPYVVRAIVIYGRSNCLPAIPEEDEFFLYLKKHLYFYMDILLSHEDDCAQNKCEEVYYALQDLDNGYSYVFEVSKNAKKIHDCAAKLLAHPFQRPLQKNTEYSFGSQFSRQD